MAIKQDYILIYHEDLVKRIYLGGLSKKSLDIFLAICFLKEQHIDSISNSMFRKVLGTYSHLYDNTMPDYLNEIKNRVYIKDTKFPFFSVFDIHDKYVDVEIFPAYKYILFDGTNEIPLIQAVSYKKKLSSVLALLLYPYRSDGGAIIYYYDLYSCLFEKPYTTPDFTNNRMKSSVKEISSLFQGIIYSYVKQLRTITHIVFAFDCESFNTKKHLDELVNDVDKSYLRKTFIKTNLELFYNRNILSYICLAKKTVQEMDLMFTVLALLDNGDNISIHTLSTVTGYDPSLVIALLRRLQTNNSYHHINRDKRAEDVNLFDNFVLSSTKLTASINPNLSNLFSHTCDDPVSIPLSIILTTHNIQGKIFALDLFQVCDKGVMIYDVHQLNFYFNAPTNDNNLRRGLIVRAASSLSQSFKDIHYVTYVIDGVPQAALLFITESDNDAGIIIEKKIRKFLYDIGAMKTSGETQYYTCPYCGHSLMRAIEVIDGKKKIYWKHSDDTGCGLAFKSLNNIKHIEKVIASRNKISDDLYHKLK